jgi:rhodanese-related sulfurtransferase
MSAAVVHHIDFNVNLENRASLPEALVLKIIASARAAGQSLSLPYAGRISPLEAWQLFSSGVAQIIDVRTNEERKFVGHVPGTLHVAWQTGTSLNKNPRFVREVEAKVRKDSVVLLLCRSGKRSDAAAVALAASGFDDVYNIAEGFEGNLNEKNQRGALGGWRSWNLPWVQD